MRAHIFQHVPFEFIGSMEGWLERCGYDVSVTRFFENGPIPPLDGIDLLIITGGPMSVNDEDTCPWLAAEKCAVAGAVARGIPTVGICLGAQLIAAAHGARVYPGPEREIGWFPVKAAAAETAGHFEFPAEFWAFHWHGETFDLPEGAVRLASSRAYANQAFQLGPRAVGLQFHLETTPASAQRLIEHCRREMTPGSYVQDEASILGAPLERYPAANRLMERLLAYVTRHA